MGYSLRGLSFILLFASLTTVLVSAPPTALADRGSMSLTPGVSIYEPGQKAIIAWNGHEEILILSTDVSASEGTLALEILPLPSNPKAIEKASFKSFVTLQELIQRHAPISARTGPGVKGTVEVMFHEKIGAHDITVVKAGSALELTDWAEGFLRENGISQEVSLQKFEAIIEDYMARGFRFFALDLIEINPQQNSVEPILYRFETSFLYYPLEISSPLSGDTKITLFLLTDGKIESPLFYQLFRVAVYYSPSLWEPIQLDLTRGELCLIDLRIGELFEEGASLTVLEYEGPLNGLAGDLMITEGAIETYPSGSTTYTMLLGIAIGALCTLAGEVFIFLIMRTKLPPEKKPSARA